jgi:hypothetical protein
VRLFTLIGHISYIDGVIKGESDSEVRKYESIPAVYVNFEPRLVGAYQVVLCMDNGMSAHLS